MTLLKYIVTHLNDHIIDATIDSGVQKKKKALFIPRISLSPSEKLYPFRLQRRQFPVQTAFAMTSNKAQGQALHALASRISFIMVNFMCPRVGCDTQVTLKS